MEQRYWHMQLRQKEGIKKKLKKLDIMISYFSNKQLEHPEWNFTEFINKLLTQRANLVNEIGKKR